MKDATRQKDDAFPTIATSRFPSMKDATRPKVEQKKNAFPPKTKKTRS
jgi:hypothetical protein